MSEVAAHGGPVHSERSTTLPGEVPALNEWVPLGAKMQYAMSAQGTIQKLRTEVTQVSKALLVALGELERGRDESTVQKRRSVVASILSDAVVEECLVRELREADAVSKSSSRFSAIQEGIRNHSSLTVGGGSGGLQLSQRMRKMAAGGQS
jgi:hypothetical protein